MNTKSYTYHSEKREISFFNKRFDIYKKQIFQRYQRLHKAIHLYSKEGELKDIKALDVGCNFGFWSVILNQLGADVHGVDISEDMIEIAIDFVKQADCDQDRIKVEHMNFLDKKLPSECYDLVYFMEVIEHVNNPVDFLAEIMRVLKPGGSLIISTPNAVNTFSILKQLWPNLKGLFKEIEKEPIDTGTHLDHIYDWNPFAFYRLLFRNGFEYVNHDFITLEIPFLYHIPLNIPLLSRFSRGMIFNVKKPLDTN
ncbi:MAG: hypothetical protein COA79_17115 [Planctomycetota bacterium]|nr:MAG: hypothetical protein COA79_17115 [Planctomycetota bacterium]